MENGLAQSLTQTPQQRLVDWGRKLVSGLTAPSQAAPVETPAVGTQWRDVRAGKPLNAQIKLQGIK